MILTLALIPGLCPFDDIILFILFPALGAWVFKRFKWCKKSCNCKCHDKAEVDDKGIHLPLK